MKKDDKYKINQCPFVHEKLQNAKTPVCRWHRQAKNAKEIKKRLRGNGETKQ